jgi:hypothetical protein
VRDLFNHINLKPVINPAAGPTDNTAQVGAIIDKQGFNSVTYVISTGTLADADATFAVTLTESNDSGMAGATAVAAKDLLGTLALAGFIFSDDGKCRKVGYIGSMRYTQLTITPTNNTGAAPMSAVAILGHPSLQPTANPPA